MLPITRKTFPCAATYSNVLRVVDAEQVNQVLTQALTRIRATERCGDEPSRLAGQAEREQHVHVALDGKTLRGRWAISKRTRKKTRTALFAGLLKQRVIWQGWRTQRDR